MVNGMPAGESAPTLTQVMEALREARRNHEWPVETDDGPVWDRCTCGQKPPVGTTMTERLWLADHHDGALAHAAMSLYRPGADSCAEPVLLAEQQAEAYLAERHDAPALDLRATDRLLVEGGNAAMAEALREANCTCGHGPEPAEIHVWDCPYWDGTYPEETPCSDQ